MYKSIQNVNPEIEPVIQAPRKIPHSMMEPALKQSARSDDPSLVSLDKPSHPMRPQMWVHIPCSC